MKGRFFTSHQFFKIAIIVFSTISLSEIKAQTCTVAGTGLIEWSNTTTVCREAGVTPTNASVLIVPSGVTLDFDDNGDSWAGTRIEVYGTLLISFNGQININSSIQVKSTGFVDIRSKLSLGTATGCGYNFIIESGGRTNLEGGADDRLSICGSPILQGGGGCNPYPAGPAPYCEPTSGFSGPVGFNQSGINGTLPVTWLYFNAKPIEEMVELSWATTMEKNIAWFVLERSADGFLFQPIGQVVAKGESEKKQTYTFHDANPIIGRTYYRLKEVDFDNYTEYFPKIASVLFEGKRRLVVSPNPSEPGSPLNIEINFVPEETSTFIVSDMTGLQVYQGIFQGFSQKTNIKLKSGSYILNMRSGSSTYISRFVVR